MFQLTIYSSNSYEEYLKNILRLPKRLCNNHYFGAYKDEQLLGFTEWRIYEDGIFLNQISLFASFRGFGIGKALLEHGFFLLKLYKKNKITLDVFEDNQFAEIWYKKIGFKKNSSKYWYLKERVTESYYSIKEESTNIIVENFHTAEAEQALYDFSNVYIKTSRSTYQVGRIKEVLFRVTGHQAIEDEELQYGLHLLDDTRSLLLVSEKEIQENHFHYKGLTKRLSLIT